MFLPPDLTDNGRTAHQQKDQVAALVIFSTFLLARMDS